MNIQVKVKKIVDSAKLPEYATDGSGCFDIFSTSKGYLCGHNAFIINTGLSFEIPKGYVMLVFSRSGDGFKRDIRLANCVGVIDSDYRGELLVKIRSDSFCDKDINTEDAIAQGLVIPYNQVQFIESDILSETDRGTGGFGSTDVKVEL
jgi:dUTP pyrophosphatase